jgi:hypothetical protein
MNSGWNHWVLSTDASTTQLYHSGDNTAVASLNDIENNNPVSINYLGTGFGVCSNSKFSDFAIYENGITIIGIDNLYNNLYPRDDKSELLWYRLSEKSPNILNYADETGPHATIINPTSGMYETGVNPVGWRDYPIIKDLVTVMGTGQNSLSISGLNHQSGDLLITLLQLERSSSVGGTNISESTLGGAWTEIYDRTSASRIRSAAHSVEASGVDVYTWSWDGNTDNSAVTIIAIENQEEPLPAINWVNNAGSNELRPFADERRDNSLLNVYAHSSNSSTTIDYPAEVIESIESDDGQLRFAVRSTAFHSADPYTVSGSPVGILVTTMGIPGRSLCLPPLESTTAFQGIWYHILL